MTARRLRVLCLHGHTQTADSLRRVLSLGLIPRTAHLAEYSFAEAPHLAREASGGRTWWHNELVETPTGGKSYVYHGWEESCEHLERLNTLDGPFDGVLGFSQGASATSALLAAQSSPGSRAKSPVQFGVMVGGFVFRGQGSSALFRHRPLAMPSLHVFGDRDTIIKPTSSAELSQLFAQPTTLNHAGGHAFPQTESAITVFSEFYARQLTAAVERRARESRTAESVMDVLNSS